MDDSNSNRRYTEGQVSPSSRPHNPHLAKVVVPAELLNQPYGSNVARPSNPQAVNILHSPYPRTEMDREFNEPLEKEEAEGGNFLDSLAKVAGIVAPFVPLIL